MKFVRFFKNFFYYDKIVEKERKNVLITKVSIGLIIAAAFLALSIANIIQHSTIMLILTGTSCGVVLLSVLIGYLTKTPMVIDACIGIGCSALFSSFLVIGGNDGFAALWIVLVPIIALLVLNAKIGVITSLYFFIFLIVVFYTPFKNEIYDYGTEFCLRFPLLYTISMCLSVAAAYSTRKNECMFILEQHKAEHDMAVDKMTGIHNRLAYEEVIHSSFANCDSIGAFFFDINNLKETNDSMGHDYGDKLIKLTVESVLRTLRENEKDSFFRLGGDEFVIILKNISSKGCEAFINRWKGNLANINSEHNDIQCSVAYGYKYAEKGFDIHEVLKDADNAMYANKQAYKDGLSATVSAPAVEEAKSPNLTEEKQD